MPNSASRAARDDGESNIQSAEHMGRVMLGILPVPVIFMMLDIMGAEKWFTA
ncbi:MAG TPA: hypothetical protein PKE26_01255 [Kiritimatiellia bacterium]|nr:hypothetical protein [Kiritimatiellia bacterium]HMO97721.1 hypothetical protein [Kiritimatiellia bacterium]